MAHQWVRKSVLVDARIKKKREKKQNRKHQSGLPRKDRSCLVTLLQLKTYWTLYAFRARKVPM